MNPRTQAIFRAWLEAEEGGIVGRDGRFRIRDELIRAELNRNRLPDDVRTVVESLRDDFRNYKLADRSRTTAIPPTA